MMVYYTVVHNGVLFCCSYWCTILLFILLFILVYYSVVHTGVLYCCSYWCTVLLFILVYYTVVHTGVVYCCSYWCTILFTFVLIYYNCCCLLAVSVDVQGFAQKYPDIRAEQMINLILCRTDISRSDAKQVCSL